MQKSKAQAKRKRTSGQIIEEMVKEREAQMIHATTGVDPSASADGAREEWMMVPGEHDFLKGVMSKGIQNRTFKNEKGKQYWRHRPTHLWIQRFRSRSTLS